MKIIRTSNYDDEMYSEEFVTGFILNNSEHHKRIGRELCQWLNTIDPTGPAYFRMVDDNYQLKKFEP